MVDGFVAVFWTLGVGGVDDEIVGARQGDKGEILTPLDRRRDLVLTSRLRRFDNSLPKKESTVSFFYKFAENKR